MPCRSVRGDCPEILVRLRDVKGRKEGDACVFLIREWRGRIQNAVCRGHGTAREARVQALKGSGKLFYSIAGQ